MAAPGDGSLYQGIGDGSVANVTFTKNSNDGKYTNAQVVTGMDADIAFWYIRTLSEAVES